ncbi:elongation factor P maturation arginine rhamnosyltransferase EarP, partial [Klebsiella pneumoniae]
MASSQNFACNYSRACWYNFGDIGICWRLARQLQTEYQWQVTLWVDDLVSFQK